MLEDRVRDLTAEPINPFHKKRLRREVLERAGGRNRANRRPLFVAAFACFGAVAVALALFFVGRASAPSSGVVVVASSGSFSEEVRGDVRRVALTDGDFEFDVNHVPGTPRLLVIVPDGEIEDIGTRFHVSVRDKKTVRIHVSEGEVEFRRAKEEPLRLIAGMTFRPLATPEPPDAAPSSAAVTPTAAVTSSQSTTVVATPATSQPSATSSKPTTPSAVALAPTAAKSASSQSKPTATPSSTVADEDSLYLAIIRAEDRGDEAAAQSLAAKYLATYPNGFRRKEVQGVNERMKKGNASGQD